MRSLDRPSEAIATLREAPIAQEASRYPALAWEAAFLGCYLAVRSGKPAPGDLFGLIPEDFETVVEDRFIAKSNLVSGKL